MNLKKRREDKVEHEGGDGGRLNMKAEKEEV